MLKFPQIFSWSAVFFLIFPVVHMWNSESIMKHIKIIAHLISKQFATIARYIFFHWKKKILKSNNFNIRQTCRESCKLYSLKQISNSRWQIKLPWFLAAASHGGNYGRIYPDKFANKILNWVKPNKGIRSIRLEVIAVSIAWSYWGYCYSLLDVMLVHRRVTASIK